MQYVGKNGLSRLMTLLCAALAQKQNRLTFDSAPRQNSGNPVTSGGVWQAVQDAVGGIDDLLAQVVGGGQ